VNCKEKNLSSKQLLNLMKSRRSIRRFEERPIPHETLLRLLEAACWGPSAHNRQPWRFVILTNIQDKTQLAEVMAARLAEDLRVDGVSDAQIEQDTSHSHQRLTGAAALILVCLTMIDMDSYPDLRRQHFEQVMAVQSVAMASQNLLLLAHAEGLGACWMCAPLFCQETVREALDLPADYQAQGVIALGYPAESRTKTRESLDTRVVFK
jgi:coenzyme F420-0:L-glutamate ligase/coenzyme F420-1:gamma-L-glutamate ligase